MSDMLDLLRGEMNAADVLSILGRAVTLVPDGGAPREVLAVFRNDWPAMVAEEAGVRIGDRLRWDGMSAMVVDLKQWPGRVDIDLREVP
jgi:hypothetical protein